MDDFVLIHEDNCSSAWCWAYVVSMFVNDLIMLN